MKTKTNLNFAVNLNKMHKEATIHFCLFNESPSSNICALQYVATEYIELK